MTFGLEGIMIKRFLRDCGRRWEAVLTMRFEVRASAAWMLAVALAGVVMAGGARGQAGGSGADKTPKPGLVVLSKDENKIFIVDPVTLKAMGNQDTGAVPHEVA